MDKLLKLLGVEKLDESQASKIKEKLETLIEAKAKEVAEEQLQEEREKLIETYEQKFEEYKDDMTTKFSNFVDEILENEMVIPDQILEYARKGQLYADLIEQFKIRLGVDEGLLDEEVKGLLKEAKEEIISLRTELDEQIAEALETKSDAQELAAELYIRRKSDGLTESQKKYVLSMLEGITDRETIDSKFDILVEASRKNKNEQDDDDDDDDDDNGNGNGNDDDDDDDMDEKKNKKKKNESRMEVNDDDDDSLNEDNSPFKQHLNRYVRTLRENKFE